MANSMIKYLKKALKAGDSIVGMNNRNVGFVYPSNPRKFYPMANDKALTKEILEEHLIPTPQTYTIVNDMWEVKQKVNELESLDAFVIKPAHGSGGGGILILKKTGDKWSEPSGKSISKEQITHHIASILYGVFSLGNKDKAIIEYCLSPHPFFTDIYKKGIPDFRILMYKQQAIMAMLRVPTKRSGGKANLHQGALGIGVDMKNGSLTQGMYKNKYIDCHPDNQFVFNGKNLPDWDKTLQIAYDTSKVFPLDYLGIDIIYDKDLGPLVIEINARPGLQIQNVNKTGIISELKKLEIE
jgi:alpha-L-glutamate ligase-like protein